VGALANQRLDSSFLQHPVYDPYRFKEN